MSNLPLQYFLLGGDTRGKQLLNSNTQNIGEICEFRISDPASLTFNPRNDVAGDIPTGKLALLGKMGLRPSVAASDPPNLWAANIKGLLFRVKNHTGLYFQIRS